MQKQVVTACAFIHRNDKLLIAKRAATKKFLPDKFELPGGHTEFGETLQESLIREVEEELHIDIIVQDPFYVFTYVDEEKTKHTVEVDFFATMKNPSQEIMLNPSDHSEYRWIIEMEADALFESNDDELKAIKKGFAMLKKI